MVEVWQYLGPTTLLFRDSIALPDKLAYIGPKHYDHSDTHTHNLAKKIFFNQLNPMWIKEINTKKGL